MHFDRAPMICREIAGLRALCLCDSVAIHLVLSEYAQRRVALLDGDERKRVEHVSELLGAQLIERARRGR